jgi:glycosyltransferase involved in cell wall biosynthesis
VDLDYFAPQGSAEGPPSCVFVGALDYRPNVDGAVWFCQEIWPEIRRRHPDARVSLVGRCPVPRVKRLAEIAGVEVVGPVVDVRPYVARAAVAVVPLQIARGLQNKVLEALAMGKPVVASPPALGGLKAEPGVHLLAARSRDEWVESMCGLFTDPALRTRLGAAGRRFVESCHRWDHCLQPLHELLGLPEDHNDMSAAASAAAGTPTGAALAAGST